jgi:hypothetical protein
MSNELTGFSSLKVAQLAWNHPQLGHFAICVLWALLTRLQNNATTWPTVRQLARDLKVSRDTIIGAFAQIRAAGIMVSEPRPGGQGRLEWRLNVSRDELETQIADYLSRNKAARKTRADRSATATSRPEPPVDTDHQPTVATSRSEPRVGTPPVADSDHYRSATATGNMQCNDREDAVHADCPTDAGHHSPTPEGEHAGPPPPPPPSGAIDLPSDESLSIRGLNGSSDLVLSQLRKVSAGRHTDAQLIELVEPLVHQHGDAKVEKGVQDLADGGKWVNNLEKALPAYVKGARVSKRKSKTKEPAARREPPDRQTWINEQIERGASDMARAARNERDRGVYDGNAMRLLNAKYDEVFPQP